MTDKAEKRLFGDFFLSIIHKFSKNEKKIYIYLGIFLAIILLLSWLDILNVKKTFAFILFVLIGGAFKYAISRYRIWVEFTPIVFFAVLIGKYIGLIWIVPYILIADIMAAFIAGQGPTAGSVPYWIWMILMAVIAKPFDLLGAGMILVPLIYFIGSLALEQFVKGGLNAWRWASAVANLVINFYFFVKLSSFFIGIMI